MKKRSNFAVCRNLIGLVKPLIGYMALAVLLGLAGHLCAAFITILGGYAILSLLDLVSLSVGAAFLCAGIFALLRGILRYGEQSCNHYIAFKLLAILRDRVFRALRRLCPAKLEGKDKGNLISVITSDIELLEVFYAHTISPVAIAFLMSLTMCLFIGQFSWLLGRSRLPDSGGGDSPLHLPGQRRRRASFPGKIWGAQQLCAGQPAGTSGDHPVPERAGEAGADE